MAIYIGLDIGGTKFAVAAGLRVMGTAPHWRERSRRHGWGLGDRR